MTAAPNPVLLEVVRSGFTESAHRGSLVILAPDGTPRLELGRTRVPMYPRSSSKPLQALGMLRAGVTLAEDELAMACASHNGEPGHQERALRVLHRHGLTEDALYCPPAFPMYEPGPRAEAKRRAAMNCSGKHAAMLATCVQAGWSTGDYTEPEHKLQRIIADTVTDLSGDQLAHTGVDGCGAPLFAYSLHGLARAFGTLAVASDGPERAVADAMRRYPWLVAGTGREDTLLMLAIDGLISKGGAEGVHAMALPDGTAIALKIDDGAPRARNPVLVAALRSLGVQPASEAAESVLDGLATGAGQVLGAGHQVGELRMVADLKAAEGHP